MKRKLWEKDSFKKGIRYIRIEIGIKKKRDRRKGKEWDGMRFYIRERKRWRGLIGKNNIRN